MNGEGVHLGVEEEAPGDGGAGRVVRRGDAIIRNREVDVGQLGTRVTGVETVEAIETGAGILRGGGAGQVRSGGAQGPVDAGTVGRFQVGQLPFDGKKWRAVEHIIRGSIPAQSLVLLVFVIQVVAGGWRRLQETRDWAVRAAVGISDNQG